MRKLLLTLLLIIGMITNVLSQDDSTITVYAYKYAQGTIQKNNIIKYTEKKKINAKMEFRDDYLYITDEKKISIFKLLPGAMLAVLDDITIITCDANLGLTPVKIYIYMKRNGKIGRMVELDIVYPGRRIDVYSISEPITKSI